MSRTSPVCLFCPNPAGGNSEHIIAKRLFRRMDARYFPIKVGHQKGEKVTIGQTHTLNTYVSKTVCEPCNNGWMNRLETWFETNMGMLIEPTWPKFAPEFLKHALADNTSLALWALKTVIMINARAGKNLRSLVDQNTRDELYQQTVPEGLVVEIGSVHAKDVRCQVSRAWWTRNGAGPLAWQEHHKSFVGVIQLNHLVIRVLRAPGTRQDYRKLRGRRPLPCYPTPADPYNVDFRFNDFNEFLNAMHLVTSMALARQAGQIGK